MYPISTYFTHSIKIETSPPTNHHTRDIIVLMFVPVMCIMLILLQTLCNSDDVCEFFPVGIRAAAARQRTEAILLWQKLGGQYDRVHLYILPFDSNVLPLLQFWCQSTEHVPSVCKIVT